jgi:hypothetical protein
MKKYLLLRWVGVWIHSGPDHGREPFFHTAEQAMEWANLHYYLPTDFSRVIEINWPTDPPQKTRSE